jgi:signal transduction histidine kinase/ActR/RegA family two-component response regulator
MNSGSPGKAPLAAGVRSTWRPRWLAIALDQLPVDEEEAAFIRGAQVKAIVRLTPLVMGASCLNAIILLTTFAVLGSLRPLHWIWALALFAIAFRHLGAWRARTRRGRWAASPRTIRRVVLNGAALGAVWGFVPAASFAGASYPLQLFVTCLTAGMMAAGAFVLSTVPLAAMAYVLLVAAGALIALLQPLSIVSVAMTALLASYVAVLLGNINWSAALFIDSRLAEIRVRKEVAAREQAQAQTAHAERLTALGELAGGIAHDVNNILQVVSGGAARIERHPENSGEVARQARRIQEAVERGSAISRRLLAFARRDALRAENIEPAVLLADIGDLLSHAIGPTIRVHVEVAETASRFLADRNQLETVLLNLATNARDAMPNGGDLTISAAGAVLDGKGEPAGLGAGRYVRFSVADTGVGIDPAILGRVADPFFTTKPKGQGTGLGLSMAKGFAEQSGGALAIASEPGRGTTVTIWLPQDDALSPGPRAAARDPAPVAGAGRRILVVDDDESIREGLISSFQDLGFITFGAEDADCALAHLDGDAEIDGLVTDFSMPGMNGLDLIHEIHARKPGLPAILLTGHMGDVAIQGVGGSAIEPFALLYKPIAPARVVEQLATAMASGAPRDARAG